MSLTKKLDNLSDVLTGALITSIVGHVLTILKPEHQKNKKNGKKHSKKHAKKHANNHHFHNNKKHTNKKHKNEVACTNISCKDVLPVVLGTTAAVKGVKEGNKHNIFVSALFTIIALNLFASKRK